MLDPDLREMLEGRGPRHKAGLIVEVDEHTVVIRREWLGHNVPRTPAPPLTSADLPACDRIARAALDAAPGTLLRSLSNVVRYTRASEPPPTERV